MENIEKKYSPRGKLSKNKTLATFDSASPWKDSNIAFNWINFDYPLVHGHTDWEILLVVQGNLLHQINGCSELLTPGTGCLIGPNDKHAMYYPDRKKNDFQGISILVRDSYMRDFLQIYKPTLYDEILAHNEPLYFSVSTNSIEKYTNVLLSIQNYSQKEYCQQQCSIVFTYLMLKIMERQSSSRDIPDALKSFVRKINNPSLTKEELQKEETALPYSYSQLSRLFKKHFKCTITQYINQVKLNYAKELLSNTEIPVSQIAEELHFESCPYFYVLFKQHFNLSPLEYRKLNRPF